MDKRRYNRLAQAKHRKSKRSYKTELENAQIMLAWLNADLSEGQAAKALGMDRLSLRIARDDAIAEGIRQFEKLRKPIDAAYDGICGKFAASSLQK
jgi:gamma-glutamyl phosphate reductase